MPVLTFFGFCSGTKYNSFMELRRFKLQNFRSYSKKEFSFSSGTTLVAGPNTSGKTNLLEAIYLLSTGKSFRAGVEREMITYQKEIARVKGRVSQNKEFNDLEIILTSGQTRSDQRPKKRYLINGVGKRRMDFIGQMRSVLFRPEDLEIIIDSPSVRRNYLDEVLEQVDREYRRANLSYQKGLRQRNKLLEQIRDKGKPHSVLFFWDKLLLENGALITQKREELITLINQKFKKGDGLKIGYERSLISPQRLAKYAREEVAAAMTLVGPHRDDLTFYLGERDLRSYGSRGEQRMAVFNLKLAELEFVSEKTDQRPILLLDDIFSELDQAHRREVLKIIPQQQTIITATDFKTIKAVYRRKLEVIKLN